MDTSHPITPADAIAAAGAQAANALRALEKATKDAVKDAAKEAGARAKTAEKAPPKAAYGIREAAEALNISRSTAWKLVDLGIVQHFRIGERRLIPATEIDRLIASGGVSLDRLKAAEAVKKGA